MNIVVSYIHYPVSMAGYMKRALNRIPGINVRSVGPYSGDGWIPWKGGIQLPVKYDDKPDIIISNGNKGHINHNVVATASWVESQMISQFDFQPDLFLNIDAGWHLRSKPKLCPNFFIGTDPHVLNYSKQREIADKFFCMQTPYKEKDDIYLPYAYDPEVHTPLLNATVEDAIYDVALVGLMYPSRVSVMNKIKQLGFRTFLDTGPAFDEAREIYHKSLVGFNWSSRLDLTARVWELAAMGIPAVVNDVPDYHKFFESHDMVVFSNEEQAVQAIVNLLNNPEKAANIAQSAYDTVLPHTWDNRMKEVLSYV